VPITTRLGFSVSNGMPMQRHFLGLRALPCGGRKKALMLPCSVIVVSRMAYCRSRLGGLDDKAAAGVLFCPEHGVPGLQSRRIGTLMERLNLAACNSSGISAMRRAAGTIIHVCGA
jgi:hypothetical protein